MSAQQIQGRLQAHHDHGWLVIESDCGGLYIKVEKGTAASKSMPPARRLVACWNACDGIPTEALEAAPRLDGAWAELAAQRDELLAALEKIAGFTLSQFMGPHDTALECCVTVACAAIAKVKGGAA